ncbi:hypothetical protein Kisp02_43270 [Kineosporia sp. NBRC 101731]|nr:hypothetical protein Kisp02_43270 [Kineosporia sp. NBRC 101731]
MGHDIVQFPGDPPAFGRDRQLGLRDVPLPTAHFPTAVNQRAQPDQRGDHPSEHREHHADQDFPPVRSATVTRETR